MCSRCPLPSEANARTSSDPVSGTGVRARVRRLFEVVHLRRRAHLRSVTCGSLSGRLLRDWKCEDVEQLLTCEGGPRPEDLYRRDYTEAFAAERHRTQLRRRPARPHASRGGCRARGRAGLDVRLDRSPDDAVPGMTFERRSGYALEVAGEAAPEPSRARTRPQRPHSWRIAGLMSHA